jgi:glycosyltransferase involved in cell wall biosynthesis
VPVLWDIHHADVDPRHVSRSSRWTNHLCARLSGVVPERIVFRAEASAASHRGLGYRMGRALVIPNGFDVDAFRFDARAGRGVREELAIPSDAPVVGLLARVHPDKGHGTFLAAARRVLDRRPDAVFLLAGDRAVESNEELSRPIDELGLRGHVRLLGLRRDVAALLSAIDVLASSSRTEAFPLVLGEAMACGIVCAATDCGDSRQIVGDTGRIVPPGDPEALAGAIVELLSLPPAERAALGAAARTRVCERYDLRVIARRYLELYAEAAAS